MVLKANKPKRRSAQDRLSDAATSLCSAALAMNLLMVIALLAVLGYNGLSYFWQRPLVEMHLAGSEVVLGEIHERKPTVDAEAHRVRIKTGNRDVTGSDFRWIDERDIESKSRPESAMVFERMEYGNFYGTIDSLHREDETLVHGDQAWPALQRMLKQKRGEKKSIHRLEKREMGKLNHRIERLRIGILRSDDPGLREQKRVLEAEFEELSQQLFSLRDTYAAEYLVMKTGDGIDHRVPVGDIVRAIPANRQSVLDKAGLYVSRVVEFVVDDPRESNTEGGIFPALFGTVMMVFIMSFAVAPLGVLAALYLREYAKQGLLVRIVRVAVNNLAGVPSIVYGVFGLGFFVYFIGDGIDRMFFSEVLPTPTWGTGGILWGSLTLALLTVPVVIVATEEGLAAVPRIVREGSLALGATKFETTWRVVLPASAPGILTGMILAMSRAAGEVAPLMIVGMVKLAPSLPIDGNYPFVHLERKFMHLGFHIYDVGFQSPNVEAAKPLVFATALLLIVVVTFMNLGAIAVRNRLRRKYATSAV
ncbi:MAG: phosphate ABC transporter permease PstA [Acidobacteriota bacterium]|nr:phosphate ABC transporter permease PstA [Acidobacteriota bacterium]